MNQLEDTKKLRVLHVVVGHGLQTYFLNAVRSVTDAAPADQVLVIDNASPSAKLRTALQQLADSDPKIDLILRTENSLRYNRKVGSLYDAYSIAFEWAIERRFDLLHLIQGDFQMMWWDDELISKSWDLFTSHPRCVNIDMKFLSQDMQLTDDLLTADSGLTKLRKYGLTDTGLYHLGRWKARDMQFGPAEQKHAQRYLGEGLEVLCHPWPADAPIPWPAVIRNGVQRGKEVTNQKPYILKPLTQDNIADLKSAKSTVWLEDACIPWGWVCATPMWVSGLDSIDYWVLRYRDAKKNGLHHLLPRPDLRGIDGGEWRAVLSSSRHRPPFFDLFFGAPGREAISRIRRKLRPRGL